MKTTKAMARVHPSPLPLRNIVSDVVSHKYAHFLTVGLVFTIWTTSSGFAAMIDGVDVVYRVRETRPVW